MDWLVGCRWWCDDQCEKCAGGRFNIAGLCSAGGEFLVMVTSKKIAARCPETVGCTLVVVDMSWNACIVANVSFSRCVATGCAVIGFSSIFILFRDLG